jgi:hypothetical protein
MSDPPVPFIPEDPVLPPLLLPPVPALDPPPVPALVLPAELPPVPLLALVPELPPVPGPASSSDLPHDGSRKTPSHEAESTTKLPTNGILLLMLIVLQ